MSCVRDEGSQTWEERVLEAVSDYGLASGLAALAVVRVENVEGRLAAETDAFRRVMKLVYQRREV